MTSIAIVGHGAELDGAGLGAVIDGCGFVLRMHDCWWQFGDGAADDFGTRWDFGILPGPWGENLWWRDYRPVCARPHFGWWRYGYRDRGLDELLTFDDKLVLSVDLGETRQALLRPGMERAAPTRGLAAALVALQLFSRLERLVLFGCDRLRDGTLDDSGYSRRCPRHGEEAARNLTGAIVGPHHFGAERDLLRARAAERGVALDFVPPAPSHRPAGVEAGGVGVGKEARSPAGATGT
jgi:hypothetical protein